VRPATNEATVDVGAAVLDVGVDVELPELSMAGTVVVAPPLGIVGPVGAGTTDDDGELDELDAFAVLDDEVFAVLEDDVEEPPARVDETSEDEPVVGAVVVVCAPAIPAAPPTSKPAKRRPTTLNRDVGKRAPLLPGFVA
jgi:hypothetical protein